jgi:ribose 1,5-bisphosphate isomerase
MKTWEQLYSGLEDMSVKGGSDIGIVAAQTFLSYLKDNIRLGFQNEEKALEFAERLKNLKPSMGSVHNAIDDLVTILKTHQDDTQQMLILMDEYVSHYQQETNQALDKIAKLFSSLIENGDRLLTHSFTRSVLLAFENALALGKEFSVISAESRPRNEGAYFASLLAGKGLNVTLITDAAVAHYMPQATKVLVGADALYADGTIVNKMGTMNVAIVAREFHKPVYVLTITTKLYFPSLFGKRLNMEKRPVNEVLETKTDDPVISSHLTVENIFFEEVPPDYITYLVTEKGLIKPCQLLNVVLPDRKEHGIEQ